MYGAARRGLSSSSCRDLDPTASCTAWHSENSVAPVYVPRRPRIMHVEFLVKTPTEIYSMHDLPQISALIEQGGVWRIRASRSAAVARGCTVCNRDPYGVLDLQHGSS